MNVAEALSGAVKLAIWLYDHFKSSVPALRRPEVLDEMERLRVFASRLDAIEVSEWEQVGGRR